MNTTQYKVCNEFFSNNDNYISKIQKQCKNCINYNSNKCHHYKNIQIDILNSNSIL